METLGERLKRLRTERNLTQEQLAKEAGVKQATISGIESGSRVKQSASLIEIAEVLGIDGFYLKYGYGKKTKSSLTDQESVLINDFRALTDAQRIEYSTAVATQAELNKARAKIGLTATDLRPTGT